MISFAWSKTPLKMLLILALAGVINFGLILGIQMVANYRFEGPVDEALLTRISEDWDGCEIQDHKEISNTNLHIYLIKLPDGSAQFVTFRKHYLLNRYRLLDKACQSAPKSGETLWLKAGVTQIEVSISEKTFDGLLRIKTDTVYFGQHARVQFKNQMILSIAGLCALELAVWCLLFRKEEIA